MLCLLPVKIVQYLPIVAAKPVGLDDHTYLILGHECKPRDNLFLNVQYWLLTCYPSLNIPKPESSAHRTSRELMVIQNL